MKDKKDVDLFIEKIGDDIKRAILAKLDGNLDNFIAKSKEFHPNFEWNLINITLDLSIAKYENGVKTDKTEGVMTVYLDLTPELFFTEEDLKNTNYKPIKKLF